MPEPPDRLLGYEIVEDDAVPRDRTVGLTRGPTGWTLALKGEPVHAYMVHPDTAAEIRKALEVPEAPMPDYSRLLGYTPNTFVRTLVLRAARRAQIPEGAR